MRFGQVVSVSRSRRKSPFKGLFKKRRTSSRRKKSAFSKLLAFFSF